MEKIISRKWKRKNAEVAVLISDKIDFKTKAIFNKRQRAPHNDKRNNPTRGCNPSNIYAPNTGAPKYVKQILMDIKGEINRNTVIIGDFNSQLTSMDRSSRQNINKETAAFNDTLFK